MTIIFTGTTSEIRLKNLVHSVLVLNELGSTSAYTLSHAGTANSGFSFGYVQWDLASNSDAIRILRDVLKAGSDLADSDIGDILKFLDVSVGDRNALGNNPSFGQGVVDLINDALSSEEGRAIIDTEHVTEINKIYNTVLSRINSVTDPEDRAFLQTDVAFVFLSDFRNQLGFIDNGAMHNFIQGKSRNFGDGTLVSIEGGQLGLDDLLNAYLHTTYAAGIQGLNDELRRFQNVIQVTDWNEPANLEEARGLNRVYQDRIVPRESALLAFGINDAARWLPEFIQHAIQPANDMLIQHYASSDTSITEVIVDPRNPAVPLDTTDDNTNDLILGEGGNDVLNSGGANDYLYGETGHDSLNGGEGRDFLIGGSGGDILDGGSDADTLYGSDVNSSDDHEMDTLNGGSGTDTYYVNNGDLIQDDDGVIYLEGEQFSFTGTQIAQDSEIYRNQQTGEFVSRTDEGLIYFNPARERFLQVQANISSGQFGLTLNEYEAPVLPEGEIVLGDQGTRSDGSPRLNDCVSPPSAPGYHDSHETLFTGQRVILTGQGEDFVEIIRRERDAIFNARLPFTEPVLINAGSGNDLVESGAGNDHVYGGADRDILFGNSGHDHLYGEAGNDILNGATGNDILQGGADSNLLFGYAGNDILLGGSGRDVLYGDSGVKADIRRDLYLPSADYRFLNHLAADQPWGFELHIEPNDYPEGTLHVTGYDAPLLSTGIDYVPEAGDSKDFLSGGAGEDVLLGEFGEDVLLGGADNDFLEGGEGHDLLYGGEADDFLMGDTPAEGVSPSNQTQGGNDLLHGGSGHDELQGLGGNDQLYGDTGQDELYGGGGDDFLHGGADSDNLSGHSGNDYLYGNAGEDFVFGNDGDDYLNGGAGRDFMSGGMGNDTYYHNAGDGLDTLNDSGDGEDVLRLGPDIRPSQVRLIRSGENLKLSFTVSGGAILIQGWFTAAGQIERIEFADGTVWTTAHVIAEIDEIQGSNSADHIVGTAMGEVMLGFENNDLIEGDGGDDSLAGGDGNDTLRGGQGRDILLGGHGEDILQGGIDSDILEGGNGVDLYIFNLQDGEDTLIDSGLGVLQFGEGILAADIRPVRDGDNVVLAHVNGQDRVILQSALVQVGAGVSSIQFAEGTIWNTGEMIGDLLAIKGTETDDVLFALPSGGTVRGYGGNDILNGSYYDDRLFGGSGDDILNGDSGNDRLIGGEGNDRLFGGTRDFFFGTGDDIYEYAIGDGHDVILYRYQGETAGFNQGNEQDYILFGSGIAQEKIVVAVSEFDLVLQLPAYDGSITLEYAFEPGNIFGEINHNQLGSVLFRRSTLTPTFSQWRWDDVVNSVYQVSYDSHAVMQGVADRSEFFRAYGGYASIYAGDGNDTLVAGGYGNILQGGRGNDLLLMGADNTYRYHRGDGNDRLTFRTAPSGWEGDGAIEAYSSGTYFEIASGGTLWLGPEIEAQQLVFSRTHDGRDLSITDTVTGQVIVVESWFIDSAARLARIEFSADGSVLLADQVTQSLSRLSGTLTTDRLFGSSLDEVIDGYDGDDKINAADGNDIIHGGAGNDVIYAGRGRDEIYGGSGNDQLFGGEFSGNSRTEVSDIFVYNLGDGADEITGSANDILRFGTGIRAEDIVIETTSSGFTQEPLADFRFRLPYEDLILRINAQDSVTLKREYTGEYRPPFSAVGRIEFTDRDWIVNSVSGEIREYMHPISGTEVADVLSADSVHFALGGAGGHDQLLGNEQDNLLVGGTGDDLLEGGQGNDTYVFARGQGHDVIRDSGGIDRLYMGTEPVLPGQPVIASRVVLAAVPGAFSVGSDSLYAYNPLTRRLLGYPDVGPFPLAMDELLQSRYIGFESRTLFSESEVEHSLLPDQVRLTRTENNLQIQSTLSDDQLILENWFIDPQRIEEIVFQDMHGWSVLEPTVWHVEDILARLENANTAPALTHALGDAAVQVDAALNLAIPADTFADADVGDVLHLSATRTDGTALPDWLHFDVAQGLVSGIPMSGDIGEQGVRVTATDSHGASVSDEFVITVLPLNSVNATAGVGVLLGSGGGDLLQTGQGDDLLYGQAGADTLIASDGNDELYGGAGADRMLGGSGNDTYEVNDIGDGIIELSAEGRDLVHSSIDYTLGDNLERLILQDSAIRGGGNALDNTVTGNALDNVLSGMEGNDRLAGGAGQDELLGSYGNDELYGGADADRMLGGAGNDSYSVDNPSDIIVELTGEGRDVVTSSIDYTLGENLERLILQGDARVGHGNALDNFISGNAQANFLTGGAGADILTGGGGDDILAGGSGSDELHGEAGNDLMQDEQGNDTYVFAAGDGQDIIRDLQGSDSLIFNALNPTDLWFYRHENDLRMGVIGTTDTVTMDDWYSGTDNRIERIRTSSGYTLLDSQVEQLVQAMAAFNPVDGAALSFSASVQSSNIPLLVATSWSS